MLNQYMQFIKNKLRLYNMRLLIDNHILQIYNLCVVLNIRYVNCIIKHIIIFSFIYYYNYKTYNNLIKYIWIYLKIIKKKN